MGLWSYARRTEPARTGFRGPASRVGTPSRPAAPSKSAADNPSRLPGVEAGSRGGSRRPPSVPGGILRDMRVSVRSDPLDLVEGPRRRTLVCPRRPGAASSTDLLRLGRLADAARRRVAAASPAVTSGEAAVDDSSSSTTSTSTTPTCARTGAISAPSPGTTGEQGAYP